MAREIIVEFPSPLTDKEKKMIYGYKGEVVRCEDCKHLMVDTVFYQYWCDGRKVELTDYCSKGERRENGKID